MGSIFIVVVIGFAYWVILGVGFVVTLAAVRRENRWKAAFFYWSSVMFSVAVSFLHPVTAAYYGFPVIVGLLALPFLARGISI